MSPQDGQIGGKPPLDRSPVGVPSRLFRVDLKDTPADLYTRRARIRDWYEMQSGFVTGPIKTEPELSLAHLQVPLVRTATFLLWVAFLNSALQSHQVGDFVLALGFSLGFATLYGYPLLSGFSGISRKWRFSDSRLHIIGQKVLDGDSARSRLYRFSVFRKRLLEAVYVRFGRQSDVYFLSRLGDEANVPRGELPKTLGQLMQAIYLFLQDQELSGNESAMTNFVAGLGQVLTGDRGQGTSEAQTLRGFLTQWFGQVPRWYRKEAARSRRAAFSVFDRYAGLTTIIASILPAIITPLVAVLSTLGR